MLSQWVGEAEKQLRLLFDEASRLQPSIIFFDEIDGLAPVRSSKQDYIHASIVSTLLALMDGLDSRGQVILIGATNRIDSLDAALRRPGRFDRELQFALPDCAAREQILAIHTAARPLPPPLLSELAARTHGFCGADLRALTAEAALRALRAAYPIAFEATDKYVLDVGGVTVTRADYLAALACLSPASQRAVAPTSAPLPAHLTSLLGAPLAALLAALAPIFPPAAHAGGAARSALRGAAAGGLCTELGRTGYPSVCRPHLLLHGPPANGQAALGLAAMHALEHCHLYALDAASLAADGSRSPQEACAHVFAEARKTLPAVVLLPAVDSLLLRAEPALRATLAALIGQATWGRYMGDIGEI